MEVQAIKQRFGIIGNNALLVRAIDIARQVAPTDLTVLITGESGTGKEVFPQIIHQLSSRKHGPYIAVNCGAIPEGTIDSELFGHEKGSFTGALEARKGYFEEVNGGTIFLDEVAELPLSTQVRLLRVLESGEFLKVGSSKVLKTNVRLVAATNVNVEGAIHQGKFREDLYYRLSSVPIIVPPLRDRKDDIYLLFRKFAVDFAEKYRMPVIELAEEAKLMLENYRWPGNVRHLAADALFVVTRDGENLVLSLESTKLGSVAEVAPRLPDLLRSARAGKLAQRARDRMHAARAEIDLELSRTELELSRRLEKVENLGVTMDRTRFVAVQLDRVRPSIVASTNAVIEHASVHLGSELAQLGAEWIGAVAKTTNADELKAAVTAIEEQWTASPQRIAGEVRTLVMGGAAGVARDLYPSTVEELAAPLRGGSHCPDHGSGRDRSDRESHRDGERTGTGTLGPRSAAFGRPTRSRLPQFHQGVHLGGRSGGQVEQRR